jgi:hypothetical protein
MVLACADTGARTPCGVRHYLIYLFFGGFPQQISSSSHISSCWNKISLHAKNQEPRLSRSVRKEATLCMPPMVHTIRSDQLFCIGYPKQV